MNTNTPRPITVQPAPTDQGWVKPCPFCGSRLVVLESRRLGPARISTEEYRMVCHGESCCMHVYTNWAPLPIEAIKMWNTRKEGISHPTSGVR